MSEEKADYTLPKKEVGEESFTVEEEVQSLGPAGLAVPSSVLLVDQAGNVLGDLSMTLDSDQMPVFITHVAKASDVTSETTESVIELSEVNPAPKRKRKDDDDDNISFNIKKWLTNFQRKINDRLKTLDDKVSALDAHCQLLRQKTENLATQVNKMSKLHTSTKGRNGTIIVGLPPSGPSDIFPIISSVYSNTSAYQIMTHNSEAEYPDGSWLGDPDNPEMRVRCRLTDKDLDYVAKNCPTAEKMALTLLDYLFDRETQACSNISGNSKHGKKQLDPLKIYGIRCHIIHHFGVDENAWQKIKLNLDSKCRTAFRRKLKGMPLTVKAFKDGRNGLSSLENSNQLDNQDDDSKDGDGIHEEEELPRLTPLEEEEQVTVQKVTLRLGANRCTINKVQPRLLPKMSLGEEEEEDESSAVLNLMQAEIRGQTEEDSSPVTIHPGEIALSLPLNQLYGEPQVLFASQNSQLIQTEQGDFQLLQATPEQLAQIQAGHPVQILTTTTAAKETPTDSCQDPC